MSKSSKTSDSAGGNILSSGQLHREEHHHHHRHHHHHHHRHHHRNDNHHSNDHESTNQKLSKIKMKKLKCVFVGDDAVGKTSLIVSYTTNGYPTEYVPTAFDTYSVLVTIDNKPCQLQLCDTAGQDDFDSIRPLCYNHADVFLVSFSVVSPRSFRNICQKWLPEIRRTITGGAGKSSSRSMPPFILIGTQCDLRHDVKVLIELNSIGEEPISSEYAKSMAKKLGAICYIECSALTQKNLKEVFDSAILAGLEYQKNRHHRHNESCSHHRHHRRTDCSKTSSADSACYSGRGNDKSSDCSHSSYKHQEIYGQQNQQQPIYQEYYHRHFLPLVPPKSANISDAKLVGWRKSLTKLSAQEALKSEAAEMAASQDEDNQTDYEYHTPISHTKLSTFSTPLSSPVASPKFSSQKNLPQIKSPKPAKKIMENQCSKFSPTVLVPTTRPILFSDPEDDQGFHDESPSDEQVSDTILGLSSKKLPITSHYHYDQSKHPKSPRPQRKLLDKKDSKKARPQKSSPTSLTNQMNSTKMTSTATPTSCCQTPSLMMASMMTPPPTPYDYNHFQHYNYKQMIYGSNDQYTCYQTPYGTTVAVAQTRSPPGPIYQPRCPPSTPVIGAGGTPQTGAAVLGSVLIPFHHLRTSTKNDSSTDEINSKKQQQNCPAPFSSPKTNLASTLRSSSFFFLPSNTLKKMKQKRKEKQQQKANSTCSSSNSDRDNVRSSSPVSLAPSEAGSASGSSIHSSNELFRSDHSNNNIEHGQHYHHRKSMLDLFHQMMSTSVTELRNRKSSMFKRLASSLSSSSSSQHHHHQNTSSSGGSSSGTNSTNKEKQRLKSEKLKDFYYYDSYDYEEIDLDRRGKCCGLSPGLWSCCFPKSF